MRSGEPIVHCSLLTLHVHLLLPPLSPQSLIIWWNWHERTLAQFTKPNSCQSARHSCQAPMDTFIGGIGERYLERKVNACPDQLGKLAKKQWDDTAGSPIVPTTNKTNSSHGKDAEIERLRKELAATKLHHSGSDSASMHRRAKAPKTSRGVTDPASQIANNERQKLFHREDLDTRRPRSVGGSRLSQGDINRLALQHADTRTLPLKAGNLELLTSQQHSLGRANKHGGSAALLHASRAQQGPRETLAYSSLDAQGNPSTMAFRPHRSSERSLCLVEVLEEPDERQGRSSQHVRRYVKQSDLSQKQRDSVRKERRAVETG